MVLRELITLELRLRRELGERPTPEDYHGEFPGRTDLIGSVFDSLTAAGIAADGVPTVSRDGTDTGPDDPDATLTYSVGREGGGSSHSSTPTSGSSYAMPSRPGGVIQDRYRIDRELGRGGMGVVLLGRDLRLDRPVAIKVSLLLGRARRPDVTRLGALRVPSPRRPGSGPT